MARFYHQALRITILLLLATGAIIALGILLSEQTTAFLPGKDSHISWHPAIEPPEPKEGDSVEVLENGQRDSTVSFNLHPSADHSFPYTSFIFYLSQPQTVADLANISGYSAIRFNVQCAPKNVLVFAIYSYVDGVTQLSEPETYRVSPEFFTCNNRSQLLTFNLEDMDSADWWLERYGLSYTDREADLSKVHGFAINNSLQSPNGISSNVTITDLELVAINKNYLWLSIVITLLLWIAYIYWLVKAYVRHQISAADQQIKTNRPLIAYKQLSIQQKSDDLKTRLLRFIANEYMDPELKIEATANELGTTRTQVNNILKAELELTFTAYVNKLRLTEAARLLHEEKQLSIKQIALSVGFANVTYFNTLFKKEYSCTPKAFRESAG